MKLITLLIHTLTLHGQDREVVGSSGTKLPTIKGLRAGLNIRLVDAKQLAETYQDKRVRLLVSERQLSELTHELETRKGFDAEILSIEEYTAPDFIDLTDRQRIHY